jgi:hypothetical protein
VVLNAGFDEQDKLLHVILHPSDKKVSSTRQGLWKVTIMTFGLCNAPAKFESLMDSILKPLFMKPGWCAWMM